MLSKVTYLEYVLGGEYLTRESIAMEGYAKITFYIEKTGSCRKISGAFYVSHFFSHNSATHVRPGIQI